MLEQLKIRFVLLVLGFILGCLLALLINIAWFFFTLVVLGYGDSGPDWLIEFETLFKKISIIIGVLTGLIASQLFYYRAFRKRKDLMSHKGDVLD